MSLKISLSEAIRKLPWNAAFGLVVARNVDAQKLQQRISGIHEEMLGIAAPAANRDRITQRMAAFEEFFANNGLRSPLSAQFEQVQRKGLPQGIPLVQALLLAEMSTGLLMGAQDALAVQGDLVYDLARAGETFQGMRSEVQCREGEIVLRDEAGVIASLLQGPDHRTRLGKSAKDVVFFVFAVPTITAQELWEGAEMVRRIFQDACADCRAEVHEAGTSLALS
jgi:DNA/RNA-binding domain of Phe-tRNA-synthetase-like protein